jgi:cleavage stimulation factor subunit 3
MAGFPGGEYEAYAPGDPVHAIGESEDDDYDPSNFVTATAATESRASSANFTPPVESTGVIANGSAQSPLEDQNSAQTNGAMKPPPMHGGFVIQDDDEDDEVETDGVNESLGTAGTTQAAQPADNTLSTSEQSISEKATQDSGVAAPSTAHSTVVAATTQPISTSSLRSPVAVFNASSGPGTPLKMTAESSATISKARLPQDRVGILEDRIAEDPRGDVDAWLSLIAEYRSKNKLDDARKAYERFFKVFPSAVSLLLLPLSSLHVTNLPFRLNSGWRTRLWSLNTTSFIA